MNRKEVVFCGNSVYLCGLAAGLQGMEQLRIRMVDDELANAIQELKMLTPDVVISECIEPMSIKDLFCESPCPLLIGVDAVHDSLAVFTGETTLHVSVEELAQVIWEYANTQSI